MSIEAMSLVLNHSKAEGRAKLVLIGIANHHGDQGAWPSIATLARYANSSEKSIQRDLKTLVDLGELRIEYQSAPTNSKYKTNLYWITLAGATDDDLGATNLALGATNNDSRGDKFDDLGATRDVLQNIIKKPNKKPQYKREIFSENWTPSDEQRIELQAKYPSANLDEFVAEMKDYILANGQQGSVKDMAAKFRNWMRTADTIRKGALSKKDERNWWN